MPALITELIDKVDSFEIVRDQIAAILKVESENQVALARTAGKPDPAQWALRVFVERSNPWEAFQDDDEDERFRRVDRTPIVNVWFQRATFDKNRGDAVKTQAATPGIFNIDCYGCGVARDRSTGHDAGDELAAREAQRAVRWCRNILMSAQYFRLGFPRSTTGIVLGRWPDSIEAFQPKQDERSVQQIDAARFALAVEFNEYSPQVVGQPLEIVASEVTRGVGGEVLLRTQINFTP